MASRSSCCDAVCVDTRKRARLAQSRSAGTPTAPAASPRDLPHPQTAWNPSSSRKRGSVHGGWEPEGGHRFQRRVGLRDETSPKYRDEAILLDTNPCSPKRGDISMAAALTAKNQLPLPPSRPSARPILVQDKHPSTSAATNLPLFAVESFGRLGREGGGFIDQSAASVVGGGMENRKGIYKNLLWIFSVITQV